MDRGIVFDGKDIPRERAYEYMARLNPTARYADPATFLHPGHDMERMKAGLPQSYQTMKSAEKRDEMDPRYHFTQHVDPGKHRGDSPGFMRKETAGE